MKNQVKHGRNRAKYPVLHHNIMTLSDDFEGVKTVQITTNVIVLVPLNKNNFDQIQSEYIFTAFTKVNFRDTFDKKCQIIDFIVRVKKTFKDCHFLHLNILVQLSINNFRFGIN